uniref:Serpin domain-containing protein n=1 Tax=Chelydra serpentina TaxID=8475 RepID=A0A8C3TE27_CHESE
MISISEATTKFCFDFFKVLNKDYPSDNIIYSPLSISSALGMVLLGARGNTATQMQKVGKHFLNICNLQPLIFILLIPPGDIPVLCIISKERYVA